MAGNNASKKRQQYNRTFTTELNRLNLSQRQAVDQIEGPMLVIAGPGTGKTHILAARIGKILLDTDTAPNNILCLTFTDAGVLAMRDRLLEFIGPEAHRVHIYTFHSFCNKVIQENLELFGRHDLEPLSALEQVELTRQLLDELPAGHPLRPKTNDPYFYEQHLKNLFQRMKSENWSAEHVEQNIETYISSLPEREEFIYKRKSGDFKKGDLKKWKYDDTIVKMNRLKSAAQLYDRYIELMRKMRRYDYDDMILWVLDGFKNNEALLRTYQEQYLYILVDEYQDTNGAQNTILSLLSMYWESPNIFIVGDDDQSIYEFQGARLKNITDFYNRYEDDLTLVMLKDNYRSSQNILNSSKALIDQNQQRIVTELSHLEKELTARNDLFAASNILPQIIAYPNRVQEDTAVVQKIEQLKLEGFPLNEVAVIYAKHKQARNIVDLLEQKKIPYQTKREVNILDLPLIQNLRLMLRYIFAEYTRPFSGDHLLYRMLHLRFWNINSYDLARLSLYMAKHQYVDQLKWRDIVADEKVLQKIGLRQPERVLTASGLLEQLIRDVDNSALIKLIEKLINRSGMLAYLLLLEDKSWQLQVLKTFFDFVIKETDRNPRLNLEHLLDTLKNMDDNRLPIEVNRTVIAEDGVNLITAHSSKGLEFQYVFLIDCVKENWEPSKSRAARNLPLPDSLTYSGEEDAMEARRRLFYVSMTRAKEQLHLSFARKKENGKSLQYTQYIDEIIAEIALEIKEETVVSEMVDETNLLLMKEPELPLAVSPGKDAVDALLANFSMSISSLNTFLRCPLSFYYEYVLRVPTATSEYAAYGTSMHYALQRIFDKMRIGEEKKWLSVSAFVQFFEEEMTRHKAYFSPKSYRQKVAAGKVMLEQYYDQFNHTWPQHVLVEASIRNIEFEGIPLNGTIDRVDLVNATRAEIVDYKTGTLSDRKFRGPTSSQPLGGTYWRQLYFYKILFELSQNERKATRGSIAYLEPDIAGRFPLKSLDYDERDEEFVKDLIRSTQKRIDEHDFYEGCGEASCLWCGFVREQQERESFADLEIEALDD